ncbi:MAG TPA: hypothetical protein VKV27_09025 [Solirubrobacteraceae bacterium]|nr:hypothetical protein [Solirubrobacteraceae bacterium]
MRLLLITAATSKVPFFILGGAFAAWAAVLAWLGLTRPQFPYGERGSRLVMLATLVLMALAIGASIATA